MPTDPSTRFKCCIGCSRSTAKEDPRLEALGVGTDHAACALRTMCPCHARSGGTTTLPLPSMEAQVQGLALLDAGQPWEVGEGAFLIEAGRITFRFPGGATSTYPCAVEGLGEKSLLLTFCPMK